MPNFLHINLYFCIYTQPAIAASGVFLSQTGTKQVEISILYTEITTK